MSYRRTGRKKVYYFYEIHWDERSRYQCGKKSITFLKGQIVTSIIYIALGACLVFMPVSTVNVICKFVFGILLILVGLYHILIYVAEKLNSTIFDCFLVVF